jgi:hypothetical protein
MRKWLVVLLCLLVGVQVVLVVRRRFEARPALMQGRAFGLGLLGAALAALLVLVWMGGSCSTSA